MENAISMERRLASAQLRPLLGEYLAEGIEGEDLALFDRLLVQLAGGVDAYISGAAQLPPAEARGGGSGAGSNPLPLRPEDA